MAEEERITQHLQMMINKRNRCEDWVASSVANRKTIKSDGKKNYDFDFSEELSDDFENSDNGKRRDRKTVNPQKLCLTFVCEWNSCNFTTENQRAEFSRHVSFHVEGIEIIRKTEDGECYQCFWESCNFQCLNPSEIKRHVNYHAYHTILKAAASELHNLWNFARCKLIGENRNWLPDLSHPFECNYGTCSYITESFQTYLNHVNAHVSETTFDPKRGQYVFCSWRGCTNFKCTSKTRMKIHLKRHTGEKTVACPTCGALFATNTKYMDHCIRKMPAKIECNRCQYCLRYFSSERLLRDHMRYHINSYKCSFCEMTCSTPATLANHVRYRHLNEKPFRCSECPFTSKSAEDCNAHITTHDLEDRYQCEADGCDFSCRSMVTFKKHFKSIHLMEDEPIYCCHLCDKKYNRGPCLGEHLRKKHKLEHPPGHTRFRYMENIDGYYRLQVERYESLELNSVKVSITNINEQSKNYILKQDDTGNEHCKKFTLCLDEPVETAQVVGALIAIDEVDEDGNVIRTSTVQEEIIEKSNEDIVFVDVNDKNIEFDDSNQSKKISQNILESNPNTTLDSANKPSDNYSSMKEYFCNFTFVNVDEPCRKKIIEEPHLEKKTANKMLDNNLNNLKRTVLRKKSTNFSDCDNFSEIVIREN